MANKATTPSTSTKTSKSTPRKATTTKAKSVEAQLLEFGAKADSMGAGVDRVYNQMTEIKNFVQEAKADITLGLSVHEAEISAAIEKMNQDFKEMHSTLESDFEARSKDLENRMSAKYESLEETHKQKVNSLTQEQQALSLEVETASRNNARQIEDLEWDLKQKKREMKLDTARYIANEYDMEVVEKGTKEASEKAIAFAEANVGAKIEDAIKKIESDKAIALNSLKSNKDALLREKEIELNAAQTRATDLEDQIAYLREQLNSEREELAKRLAAAKADVKVENDNSGRK